MEQLNSQVIRRGEAMQDRSCNDESLQNNLFNLSSDETGQMRSLLEDVKQTVELHTLCYHCACLFN